MSVADHCGLADPGGGLMPVARAGWIRWCRDDPSVAVFADLVELRGWTRSAAPGARRAVVAAVAARTKDDHAAVAALVWLLLPGACHTAEQLHDLAPDVDALVAGQLWIEAASAWQVQGPGVARTILRRTRREVCAELGVGDGAQRRDRVWASVVRVERFDEVIAVDEEEGDPFKVKPGGQRAGTGEQEKWAGQARRGIGRSGVATGGQVAAFRDEGDCGGIGGHQDLAAWVRSGHDDGLLPANFHDAAHARDWLPLGWHPDRFDVEGTNAALAVAVAEPVVVTEERERRTHCACHL